MQRWKQWVWGVAGAAGLVSGCVAHGPPPRELVDARTAYQRVSVNPVIRQQSAQPLTEAWHALLAAEREYDVSKDSAKTRSLAYVALRKAQLAEAQASIAVAQHQRTVAAQALRQTQEAQRRQSQAQLDAAQQQLLEARRLRDEAAQLAEARRLQSQTVQLQQEAQRRQEEMDRLAQAQRQQSEAATQAQRLAQVEQELEAERRARLQAETRASEEREARAQAEAQAATALAGLARQGELKVSEDARGTVLTLSGSVLFASGEDNLLPSARNKLSEVADALKPSHNRLTIEGHTDAQGAERFNEDLSFRRAERVRDFLVSQGVAADRVEVRGMGEFRPVASNGTAEGRANNRRVEIILQRDDATGVGGSGQGGPR
ncbi:OmpA family protein [Stigmatella sp. ncwal1]|uniref:OmpA family protein n=1 Tax=Stigmatella ashevillensis TaxID=2995309 RepID=A0ABT5DFA9_9BACT|nr:OmpA family protein [Stigmatella ashevillena]MDC0711483.1 OmpA family protein [Stigmatella ashevillena]